MPDKKEFLKKMESKISAVTDKQKRLYFEIDDQNLLEIAKYLFKEMGCRLSTATAIETYRGVEVLYHFSDDSTGQYYCPRIVMTDKSNPVMHSITPIFNGAEWIEREMAEYWGVNFLNHPRPEPLLTKDHPKGAGLNQPFRIRRTT